MAVTTKRMLLATVAVACFVVMVAAHSTHYPLVDRSVCWQEQQPRIYSWHAHFLFQKNDPAMVADAQALMSRFSKTFNITRQCPSLYHQDQACLFALKLAPDGPFPTAQWAAFFRPDQLPTILPWILQNRERKGMVTNACRLWNITDPLCGFPAPSFDVIIHPNSGCEYEDHGKWHVWAGNPWPLNMDAMDHADPFDNKDPDPYDGDGPMPPPA